MTTHRVLLVSALALLLSAGVLAETGGITPSMIDDFQARFDKLEHTNRLINASTNNKFKDLSLNRSIIAGHDGRFNVTVEGSDIINQRSTGRCWMFAGANVVAPKIITKLELSDFELSKTYLAFWDKMEKANRFLETMIAFRDRDITDRSLAMYLQHPFGDGGWWDYFQSLIQKYGVIPASAMPETKQSSATGSINKLIVSKLRQSAAEIRRRHASSASESDLRKFKEYVLADIYALLVYSYGEIPEQFTFRYEKEVDSTKVLVEESHTAQSFFEQYFGTDLPEYVALAHNPAFDMNTLYHFESARNVQESDDIRVLNVPIEELKKYSMRALVDSQIVWFACDVNKGNYNDSGIFAVDIYDYNETFGLDFKLTKENRIRYMDMSPNHAMVLIGADTAADGTPRKWKVENSWGSKKGKSGYWTMYDDWFDEYVLLVMIDRRLLEPETVAMLDQDPVVIEDWQPFFAALRNLQ